MPPKTKTAAVPASSALLCDTCEPVVLDPTTTAFTCEHGAWTFNPAETGPEATASADEVRAALLASLDEATLRDLLAAKTAPPVVAPRAEATKADAPAKVDPPKPAAK